MKSIISVIVPVYNAVFSLRECVNSIIAQDFKDWEVILVDDGSTDGSLELAEKLSINPRIRLIKSSHRGVAEARNLALSIAEGEYICFVDSDDYVEPSYLSSLYEKRGFDIVICGYYVDYKNSQALNAESQQIYVPLEMELVDFVDKRKLINLFESGMIHINCNKLLKRQILDKNNIRYKQYPVNEDYIFMMEYLCCSNSLCSISKPLYHWVRVVGKETGVDSIPKNLLRIYNIAHLLTRDFFKNNSIADRILYYSYSFFALKYFKAMEKGTMGKVEVFRSLKEFYRNPLVKAAYKAYSPISLGDKIVYHLQRLGCFRTYYLLNKIID